MYMYDVCIPVRDRVRWGGMEKGATLVGPGEQQAWGMHGCPHV